MELVENLKFDILNSCTIIISRHMVHPEAYRLARSTALHEQPELEFRVHHPVVGEIVNRITSPRAITRKSIWRNFNLLGWMATEIPCPLQLHRTKLDEMMKERIKHQLLKDQLMEAIFQRFGIRVIDKLTDLNILVAMFEGQAAHREYMPDNMVANYPPPNPREYDAYLRGLSLAA